jgi:predicted nucleotide-binding protein
MKALAWDDDPKSYMNDLSKFLLPYGVELVVTDKEEDFARKWQTDGPWDFVVTDLLKDAVVLGGKDDPNAGVRIANSVTGTVPVYLITEQIDLLKEESLNLSGGVIIKSKSTYPVWMAKDIVDDLKRQGAYTNGRKVFVIYGHDRLNTGLRQDVVKWLEDHGISADLIDPSTLKDQLLSGLLERMQSAAAFIALCTPDDAMVDSSGTIQHYQPRQNVLLEIGMVLGLPRGMKRLIVLQATGPSIDERSELPTDLGGLLSLRVENGQPDWDRLKAALKLRGVSINP